jgi:Sulfotransferase domain
MLVRARELRRRILPGVSGLAWLGIGAQRSGTDWISRLLVQHPRVDFGTNGKKEQAYLHLIHDGRGTEQQYLRLFPGDGILRGDWTPRYMPSMIVPAVAQRVVGEDAPIFVLLRDPVERFASAMRYAKRAQRLKTDYQEPNLLRSHQLGQYASSLEGWATVFSKERFVIRTYEEAREDVEGVCRTFWGALGLEPHRLKDPYGRAKPTTEGTRWKLPEGAHEALVAHYLPQVVWLRDHWGVDVRRWRNFEGRV